MESLKQFGKNLLILTLKVLGVVLYLAILIGPALVIDDETLMIIWVCFATLIALYSAVLHSIANEKEKTLSYIQRIKTSVKEANKKFFLGIAIFVGFIVIGSYLDEETQTQSTSTSSYSAPTTYTPPVRTYTPPQTYTAPTYTQTAPPVHYDDSYQYNYRTGYSGNYDYNYDVEGYSDSGDYFYGNVDTSGKYGDGYIYDDYGNEVYVETEWTDYGVMEATDENGNTYEFEVE